jgi:hypothetical protein
MVVGQVQHRGPFWPRLGFGESSYENTRTWITPASLALFVSYPWAEARVNCHVRPSVSQACENPTLLEDRVIQHRLQGHSEATGSNDLIHGRPRSPASWIAPLQFPARFWRESVHELPPGAPQRLRTRSRTRASGQGFPAFRFACRVRWRRDAAVTWAAATEFLV